MLNGVLGDLAMEWLSWVGECAFRLLRWIQLRRQEHRCMPVIDKVKECEEQQYCDKGRQMWDPRTNPGGPSPKARPVCQVQGAKYFWPKIHGETRPMKPVVMAALRNGYVEGCVLDDPERPGDFRAYLCLTYRGRDAWARYCSMRRMRWRERSTTLAIRTLQTAKSALETLGLSGVPIRPSTPEGGRPGQ